MPITSQVSDSGRDLAIHVNGQFNFSVYQDFRASYTRGLQPGMTIEINLDGTEYMDSSALGMLLLLRERALSEGAAVRITHCSPGIRKIFNIANFERLFEIS